MSLHEDFTHCSPDEWAERQATASKIGQQRSIDEDAKDVAVPFDPHRNMLAKPQGNW